MANNRKTYSDSRPFLKWAGGKTQLLDELEKRFPQELKSGDISKYVEPFVGGGAIFFEINQKFSFEKCYICDLNEELILSYRVIKKSVKKLIKRLEILELEYLAKNDKERETFFYEIRDIFNQKKSEINFEKYQNEWIERAAQIIFLNRTCFNGLFRVNQNGGFNVPFGKYKNPTILNEENLLSVASLLKTTQILNGDFTKTGKFIDNGTFVYFDPPYRPLNGTSSFTSYSKNGFSENDQHRLAIFYKKLDKNGAKIMLSNSDPKNENPHDTFFDELYSDYKIARVPAKRIINCIASGRGEISELIITNY